MESSVACVLRSDSLLSHSPGRLSVQGPSPSSFIRWQASQAGPVTCSRLGSLCCIATSHQLSILHYFYIFIYVNTTVSICPTLSSLHCVHNPLVFSVVVKFKVINACKALSVLNICLLLSLPNIAELSFQLYE